MGHEIFLGRGMIDDDDDVMMIVDGVEGSVVD